MHVADTDNRSLNERYPRIIIQQSWGRDENVSCAVVGSVIDDGGGRFMMNDVSAETEIAMRLNLLRCFAFSMAVHGNHASMASHICP